MDVILTCFSCNAGLLMPLEVYLQILASGESKFCSCGSVMVTETFGERCVVVVDEQDNPADLQKTKVYSGATYRWENGNGWNISLRMFGFPMVCWNSNRRK